MTQTATKESARRQQSSLERLAFYFWGYKATESGRALLFGTLVSTMVALSTLDIPAFHLFDALVALLTVAWCVGWYFRPRLRVEVEPLPTATAGLPITMVCRVTNIRRRRAAHDVSLGFIGLPKGLREAQPQPVLSHLAAGQSASLKLTIIPERRGLYQLPPVRAFSTFPFGLFRFGLGSCPGGGLVVLPSFHPISTVSLPVGSRYQPGGIALTSNIGESPEYIGSRDYRPGDSPRRIDFRAWARRARPVVREYQEEYYCRIALVLDTFVPGKRKAPPGGFPGLEAAVSLSAAVADALSRGEYLIDIFAAGPELYVFRAGRHTAHFENILEILACVEPCRRDPFDVVAPALADELANISTVVCVFLDWDASREGLVRAAREAGCSVRAFIVRDDEPTVSFAGDEANAAEFRAAAVARGHSGRHRRPVTRAQRIAGLALVALQIYAMGTLWGSWFMPVVLGLLAAVGFRSRVGLNLSPNRRTVTTLVLAMLFALWWRMFPRREFTFGRVLERVERRGSRLFHGDAGSRILEPPPQTRCRWTLHFRATVSVALVPARLRRHGPSRVRRRLRGHTR